MHQHHSPHLPIARVGHVGKRQLDDGPVTVGDYDEALEQIGGHHVVRVNVEYVAVVASPHAHLQSDVVRQVEWGLENGGTEGAE